MADLDSIN